MSQAYDRQATNSTGGNLLTPFGPTSPEIVSNLMHPVMSANASVLKLNARLFHVAAEASREWLDFLGRRLNKDAELAQTLRRAKNPQAMIDAYNQFLQRAAQDYQQEFAELMRLSSKVANGAGEVVAEAKKNMLSSRGDGSSTF